MLKHRIIIYSSLLGFGITVTLIVLNWGDKNIINFILSLLPFLIPAYIGRYIYGTQEELERQLDRDFNTKNSK